MNIASRYYGDNNELVISYCEVSELYEVTVNGEVVPDVPLLQMLDAISSKTEENGNTVFDGNTYEWMPF